MDEILKAKMLSAKTTTIVLVIALTASASGFFMGLRQTVRESENNQAAPLPANPIALYDNAPAIDSHQKVMQAVDYTSIATVNFGPNSHWTNHISNLRQPLSPHAMPIDEDVLQKRRQAHRAYDGAPPVVPHPIDQNTADSCLQCHATATQIGDVVAPAISHPTYTSCTQCHVSSKGLGSQWNTSTYNMHANNQFSGYSQIEKGERVYPDAPPTIPHTIHMRQNCMSCHGPLGTSPIRTTHPERQSCTQCHVPGSDVDKRNFAESPFPFIEELLQSDGQQ